MACTYIVWVSRLITPTFYIAPSQVMKIEAHVDIGITECNGPWASARHGPYTMIQQQIILLRARKWETGLNREATETLNQKQNPWRVCLHNFGKITAWHCERRWYRDTAMLPKSSKFLFCYMFCTLGICKKTFWNILPSDTLHRIVSQIPLDKLVRFCTSILYNLLGVKKVGKRYNTGGWVRALFWRHELWNVEFLSILEW